MRRSPPTTLPPLVCQRPVPCPLSPLLFLSPSMPQRMPPQKQRLWSEISLTADRLDTSANWRVLAQSQAHHRLSDSAKNGNALRTMHNAALPAR